MRARVILFGDVCRHTGGSGPAEEAFKRWSTSASDDVHWEYLSAVDRPTDVDGVVNSAVSGRRHLHREAYPFERTDNVGEKGWELVSVSGSRRIRFYFKRPSHEPRLAMLQLRTP
jgi:hypothetical protein